MREFVGLIVVALIGIGLGQAAFVLILNQIRKARPNLVPQLDLDRMDRDLKRSVQR
jgi:hypothetical protein